MNRFLLFCALAASVLMGGCTVREMSLSEGVFEAPAHHNFIGIGKSLPENSGISNVTVSGVYVPDEDVRIHGVYNNPEECDSEAKDCFFEKGRIKFWYDLDRFPVKASFSHFYKWQEAVAGFEIGLSKYLQARFILGLNHKNYELGMYGDLGYGFNKASYSYEQKEYALFSLVGESGKVEQGSSSYSDDNIGHFVTAFGGYVSWYYGSFGMTYSPALYAPWARRDLPITESYDDFDIFFNFPHFVSQYFGVSFWLTDHWKISGGATLLTPTDMDRFVVMGNTSVGYWF